MGLFGSDSSQKRMEEAENERRRQEEQRKRDIRTGIVDVNRTFSQLLNPNVQLPSRPVFQPHQGPPTLLSMAQAPGRREQFLNDLAQSDPGLNFANSPFLDQLQQSFLDFATPEVQRQAGTARDKTIQQLARRGTLESSVGAEKTADVERQRGEALSRIAARAGEIRSRRAGDIEKSRNSIIAQLEASGNASAAAQSAINSAQNLSAVEEFQPLGELFRVGLGTGADVLRQQSQPFAPPTLFSKGRKGSSKVV